MIRERIAEEISKRKIPLNRIARVSGIQQASLWRFLHEGKGLQFENVEKLCYLLGLRFHAVNGCTELANRRILKFTIKGKSPYIPTKFTRQ